MKTDLENSNPKWFKFLSETIGRFITIDYTKMKAISIMLVMITLWTELKSRKINEERMKRFSIFSMVQFPNSQCTLAMSTQSSIMTGTCFSVSECIASGGTSSGNCASGFGVCCFFSTSTCGSTVSRNCTYIQNPGFPSPLTSAISCSFNFEANSDTCQIRLDFADLVLSPPSVAAPVGTCTTADTFTVTSPTSTGTTFITTPPILCGTLSGSHIYFETGRQVNAGSISITTVNPAGAGTSTRSWKIKTTFLDCANPKIAPNDCTQYFTAISGFVESFNFQSGQGAMIEKLNYNVCFRQAEGFCELGFRQDALIKSSFVLDFNPAIAGAMRACADSGILLPTTSSVFKSETFCGEYLNYLVGEVVPGEIQASVNPWYLGVFSKTAPFTAGIKNVGFRLMYQQQPCF